MSQERVRKDVGRKVLTAVACVGAAAISLTVLTSTHPASLIGAAVKSAPYVGTWFVSKLAGHPKRLALCLAGGLAAYLPLDAYVSFHAVRRPQSSTDPIAALVVGLASVVIIPAGALVTFLLLRASEVVYKSVRR